MQEIKTSGSRHSLESGNGAVITIVVLGIIIVLAGAGLYYYLNPSSEPGHLVATVSDKIKDIVDGDGQERLVANGTRDIDLTVIDSERKPYRYYPDKDLVVVNILLTAGPWCLEGCSTLSKLSIARDYKLISLDGVVQNLDVSSTGKTSFVVTLYPGEKVKRQVHFIVDADEVDFVFKYEGGVYNADSSYTITTESLSNPTEGAIRQ